MERFVIAALLVAIGVAVALVLERRRPAPPTQSRWAVPTQLDRDDFADRGAVPWLVTVFTSSTCESCGRATAKAAVLASPQGAYEEGPDQKRKALHERYHIDDVPSHVNVDHE